MSRPVVQCRETALLDCKERIQKILRERPVAEWGEALSGFVRATLSEAGEQAGGIQLPRSMHKRAEAAAGTPSSRVGLQSHEAPSA